MLHERSLDDRQRILHLSNFTGSLSKLAMIRLSCFAVFICCSASAIENPFPSGDSSGQSFDSSQNRDSATSANFPNGETPFYIQPGSTRSEVEAAESNRVNPSTNRYRNTSAAQNANSNLNAPSSNSVQMSDGVNSNSEIDDVYEIESQYIEEASRDQTSGTMNFEVLESGSLVAIIGEEPVLEADLLKVVEKYLTEIKKQAPPEQYDEIREKGMRTALVRIAQTKMLARVFIDDQLAGKSKADQDSALKQIDKRMNKAFHETMIPKLMQHEKVESIVELDRILRSEGSSLYSQLKFFKDSAMAQEATRKFVPKIRDIPAIELRDHYDKTISEWQRPARAKFRVISVHFSRTRDRTEAAQLISTYFEEALTGGNFEAVARQRSHGARASDGGNYGWTTKGSLRSEVIDQAVFSIPRGRLSEILEDDVGLHFVEVIEREEARTISFQDAQESLSTSLLEIKKKDAEKKLLSRVKDRTSVWTRWPEDIPNSHPLSELYGR